jgi:phenylacetate-CoA ligase
MPARSDECWNTQMETMACGALREIEQERLRRQLEYVWEASPFYRRKWEAAGIGPQHLSRVENLAHLPFTEKRELQDAQDEPPPFGPNQCAPVDRLIRMQATGGTTGHPLRMALTRHDIEVYNELGARAAWAAGLRPGDILFECMNYSLYAGGVNDHMTFETVGACVAPVGIGQSRRLIGILRQMRVPVVLYSTPSYALHLASVARADGIDPTDLGIGKGLLSGDAGLGIPEYRRQIETTWNMVARDIYGLGELGPLAAECRDADGLHWVGQQLLIAELVDAESGAVIPAAEGAVGELVFTTIDREAQPLIRFRSHDHVQIVGTGRHGCGRTGFRFRVLGRSDDMFIVKGINVYPLGVQDVILGMRPALTGEFQILLPNPPPITEPPIIRAEYGEEVGAQDRESLRDRLSRRIRDVLVFTPKVELVPAGTLPRSERKAKRLYRLYKGEQP